MLMQLHQVEDRLLECILRNTYTAVLKGILQNLQLTSWNAFVYIWYWLWLGVFLCLFPFVQLYRVMGFFYTITNCNTSFQSHILHQFVDIYQWVRPFLISAIVILRSAITLSAFAISEDPVEFALASADLKNHNIEPLPLLCDSDFERHTKMSLFWTIHAAKLIQGDHNYWDCDYFQQCSALRIFVKKHVRITKWLILIILFDNMAYPWSTTCVKKNLCGWHHHLWGCLCS